MSDPGATTNFPNPSPSQTGEPEARPGASTANNRLAETAADAPQTRYVPFVDHPSDLLQTGPHTPSEALVDTDRTGPHTPLILGGKQIRIPAIPGFEILGILGKGGMGVVFKARQVALDRIVALKMILGGDNATPEALARFEAEARAVARFQHPNIIQIYEVGLTGDLPYFSLEFVEGGPLSKKISREPQDPTYAAKTVETLARAMHYAHERGVIHRDLKPANVLLAADGTPKITDFGLAKQLEQDSGQTLGGTVLGTPSYMAPEQAAGELEKVGPLADVYALGASLYDMLTGRPPFVGSSVLNTLEMVRNHEPVSPAQLAGKVPKDIETICLKCLQKDPARRYGSAQALADDLRNFLEGRPIAARPVGRVERAGRWAKRNPREAVLGTVAALFLVVMAIGGYLFSYSLNVAKSQAESSAKVAGEERDAKEIERQKAIAARNDAEAARVATAQQRDVSFDVIRGVLLYVDSTMRNRASLLPYRERILDLAMRDLPKIRDSVNKHPLESRTDAIAYSRMAELMRDGGKIQEATELLDGTSEILRKAAEEAPDSPASLSNLAAINNLRAEIAMRQGKYLLARNLYTSGLEMRRKWSAMPKVPAAESELAFARSHGYLGRVNISLGDPAQAVENYEQSLKHYAKLPAESRDTPATQRERIFNEERLGQAYLNVGRTDDAEQQLQRALQARQALLKIAKAPTLIRDEAVTRTTLGDFLLTARKDAAKANQAYSQALQSFQQLLKAEPESLVAQRDVAWVQYRLGVAEQRSTGIDTVIAQAHFKAALKLRESLARVDPKDMQSKIEWMLCLARAGKHDEAEKLAAEVQKTGPKDPQMLFQVACGLALASVSSDPAIAGRCRESAFAVLGSLVQSGWKDWVTLETDPDLDAIRADTRFTKLVAGLKPAAK